MDEELNIDNILGAEDIEDLFLDVEEEQVSTTDDENSEDKTSEIIKDNEIDADSLFDDLSEESDKENKDKQGEREDTESSDGDNKSSKNNFYSSIVSALEEDGIFSDLADGVANSVKTPEDFANIIEQQIVSKLDERQKRIDSALNVGVEPDAIKKYENTLSYLESIQEDVITNEEAKGENLRKQLIYQDFVNRGYSKERAEREVKKSLNAGSDIEDAKDALESNKEFYQSEYDSLINKAKEEDKKELQERQKQSEELKKSILEDNKVFGEVIVDKNTRQKVYDSISKPIYKDPESGELFTALQKYEMDNRTDFLKYVGLVFTLTDGFKNLDGLVKGKVQKEIKKGLKNLENTINNTSRSSDGNLRFASRGNEDSESSIHKGWNLDI